VHAWVQGNVGLTFLWSPPDPDARPAAKSSDERNVCRA
jgi:hypothetical protein